MKTYKKYIAIGILLTILAGSIFAYTSADTGTTSVSSSSSGGQNYNIEQATSDNAQLNTLAFDALGFILGNTCSDSFLPPGKVADFFGFQYLRDVTQSGKGHSTDFVTNAANNVLYTLNDSQKAKMLALAKAQGSSVSDYALKRFPLMIAFRRQLESNLPTSSSGLNKNSVMKYSGELYQLDGEISLARAKLFSEIINSLTTEQKAYLDNMVKGGFASWTALPDQLDKKTLTHSEDVLMMTYASEMFAWYAGDITADTYFCPERQADYFGGFYLKDAPAMGNAGYTISESITGDKGANFLATLNEVQKKTIVSIVDTQRSALNGIVQKRKEISTLLRTLLAGKTVDSEKILALEKQYGELDGEISYYYATAFSEVNKTLTTEQRATLNNIRGLDGYVCPSEKAYLYSDSITFPSGIETDFLFFSPTDSSYSPIDSTQFSTGNTTAGNTTSSQNTGTGIVKPAKQTSFLSQVIKDQFTAKLNSIQESKKKETYKKIMDRIDKIIKNTKEKNKIGKLLELKQIVQKFVDSYR